MLSVKCCEISQPCEMLCVVKKWPVRGRGCEMSMRAEVANPFNCQLIGEVKHKIV